MQIESINDMWKAACDECIEQGMITEVAYNVWFADIVPLEFKDGVFKASIYSEYKRSIFESTFIEKIESALNDIIGIPVRFELIYQERNSVKIQLPSDKSEGSFESHFTFDNFIVGSSNRYAHAAAMAVADHPATDYNPLVIYGNSGVGKTHLLFAIKNQISKNYPNKKVEYIRGEDFTNIFIKCINEGKLGIQSLADFRNRFRTVDVLLMDDIQFIAGKESTQEEFFNTFDALLHENKQIVVTSDRPPKDIKVLDERIRSRFESGLISDITPPDFETRVGIVRAKAELLKINLDENIIYFIAEHIKMNTRQLEGVVKKLHAYITLQGKTPTIAITQTFIRDIISDNTPEPIKIEEIISEVSTTFNVSESDIISKRKTAQIAFARQVAMYIARETTELSYKAIGESFGKDHATVLHNVQKIEDHLKKNPFDKELIEDIIKNLQTDWFYQPIFLLFVLNF